MKQYDAIIDQRLRNEMKQKYILQKLVGEKTWIADYAIGLASNVPWIKKRLQKMF